MEARNSLVSFLIAGVCMGLMSTSCAYDFYVGGRNGWGQNPSENYSQWAARMRFQVNDKLVFKYKKGEDSVLVVNKEAYNSCNLSNPIQKLDGGDSVFQFDRSGYFYFISGAAGLCDKGQKLIVVVMALRNKSPPTPPPSASNPPISPPSPSPKPPSSSPSVSPSPSNSSSPVSTPTPSISPSSSSAPSPNLPGSETPPGQSPDSGNGNGGNASPAPSQIPSSSSSSVLTISSFSFGVLVLIIGAVVSG